MNLKYDSEADALYIEFRDAVGPLKTHRLDARRMIDIDDNGEVGVELLFVSQGVSLEGLPHRDEIAAAVQTLAHAV